MCYFTVSGISFANIKGYNQRLVWNAQIYGLRQLHSCYDRIFSTYRGYILPTCKGYLLYKFCCVLYPYYGYLHREQPTWTEDGYDKTYGMLSFVDSIEFFRKTDT